MWNQWSQYATQPPLPMTAAPPPPPSDPIQTAAPPPPGPAAPMIGPAAPPSTAAAATVAAPAAATTNPYSQYTAAQYAALTPEQQYTLQQHWQQWQKYQEEYAKWHAQYGEQYKREMEAASTPAVAQAAAVTAPGYPGFIGPVPPTPAQEAEAKSAGVNATKITGQPQLYNQPPPQIAPTNQYTAARPPPPITNPQPQTPQSQPSYQQPPPQWQNQQSFNQPPPNFNASMVPPNNYQNTPTPNQWQSGPPPFSNNQRNQPPPPPSDSFGGQQNKDMNVGPNMNKPPPSDWNRRDKFAGPPPDNMNRGGRETTDKWEEGPPPNRGNGPNDWQQQGGRAPPNARGPNNWQDDSKGRDTGEPGDDWPNSRDNSRNRNRSNEREERWGGGRGDADGPWRGRDNDNTGPPNGRDGSRFNNWNDNRERNEPNDWRDGPNNRGGNNRNNFNNRGDPDNRDMGSNNRFNQGGWDNNRPNNWGDNARGHRNQWQDNPNNQGNNWNNNGNNRFGGGPPNNNQGGNTGGRPVPDIDEEMFDRQFKQWEEQFEDWKRANANHPDREMYERYEQEFEKQRKRIMERREQMRRRKMERMGLDPNQAPPPGNNPYSRESSRNRDESSSQPRFDPKDVKKFVDDGEDLKSGDATKGAQPQKSDDTKTKADSEKECLDDTDDTANNAQPNAPVSIKFNVQKSTPLGKRKSRFDNNGPTPSKVGKPTNQGKSSKGDNNPTEVITLDDDDDDVADNRKPSESENASETMTEIFKKSDGIPGLDLVNDGTAAPVSETPKEKPEDNTDAQKKPLKKNEKPVAEVKPATAAVIPDISKTLNDPEFMKKISEAVAKAQGKDDGVGGGQQKQHGDWQRQNDFDNENSNDRMSAGPKSFAEDENSNASYGRSSRQGMDDDIRQDNFGPNRGRGNNWGPGGGGPNEFNNCGPNNEFNNCGPNNWRPNGPNGPNNNWGPNGPGGPNNNNWGPNINWGPNGGGGPNNNNWGGPNNNNNWGPNGNGGPNNWGPNNRGGPNNWGPNNRGGGGPNNGNGPWGRNGPWGNNGPNNNNGPWANNNGPNNNNGPWANNPGPWNNNGGGGGGGNGPNNNWPNNNNNFGPNFRGPNNRNSFGPNGPNNNNNFRPDGPNSPNFGPNNRNNGSNNTPARNIGRDSSQPPLDDSTNNAQTPRNINNPFRRNENSKTPSLDGGNSPKPWTKGGGGSFGGDNFNYGDDYFRPVQVIDYGNNANAPPKVIDYGHKPVTGGGGVAASNADDVDFRPMKIINYDHASKPNNPKGGGGGNNFGEQQGRGNKRGGKNRRNKRKPNQQQQQQQNRGDQPVDKQQQQQADKSNTQSNNNNNKFNHNQKGGDEQHQHIENTAKNQETQQNQEEQLEDISDNEDLPDQMDDDYDQQQHSPAPPPPPLYSGNSRSVGQSTSIFPSTAEANEHITKMTVDHVQMSIPTVENNNTISIEEILLPPGRDTRPKKICIILRGPPGSGKSYVAKLIKEKEKEMSGNNPRVLSIDDYFLIENDYEEKCPKTGKKIPKKEILYEYDKDMEETYMQYLIKSFKKTILDNFYDFIVIDCNNNSLRTLNEFYCHAKDSGYVPYIVDLHCDLEICLENNVHERTEADIKEILNNWKPTPFHYIKLDIASLVQNVVEMEDVEDMPVDNNTVSENTDSQTAADENDKESGTADANDDNAKDSQGGDNGGDEEDDSNDSTENCGFLKSKWETDTTTENLARLDGTSKLNMKRKPTMEEYLQTDEWEPVPSKSKGKKRVRWADIEEKREQEKMRAVGFVVGQTDWKRMMDPNAAKRALNKTKYIERVNKQRR
ncbi:ZAP3 isoform X2 [Musca autumnalis]|uniref:ZAP3 isoform X2 n=1 Tax=Musca autumnalis TaxID=221902 RepID=UPI003CF11091